ncbi:DUF3291 domain-containing protein [Palleronia abyssalis]|uniref:Uncharacterized protein n=1 Tax=Palleronia abyssalis TaxID=1501240 RepID=A0A2R8BW06_9RHOB|nr:DUF3291 domain-containing protein [Palleronia abyssalis]SPJ24354.1 hypothetical protein PAA8504_02182 [Palleronia abyssalis]
MPFVSITRLRLRSAWFLPGFAFYTARSRTQSMQAGGYLAGTVLADARRAFWTMTLWLSEADIRRFMTTAAHGRALPRLMRWCDEASVVNWTQDEEILPDWTEADRRMRAKGRPSKVLHPSPDHAGLTFAPARRRP